MVNSISPAATKQLYKTFKIQDSNQDGIIQDGIDVGYNANADINHDGRLIGAELRYYAQVLGAKVPEKVKAKNALTMEDKTILASLAWEAINDTDLNEVATMYGLAAALDFLSFTAVTLATSEMYPEQAQSMFMQTFNVLVASIDPASGIPLQNPEDMIRQADLLMIRLTVSGLFSQEEEQQAFKAIELVKAYYQAVALTPSDGAQTPPLDSPKEPLKIFH